MGRARQRLLAVAGGVSLGGFVWHTRSSSRSIGQGSRFDNNGIFRRARAESTNEHQRELERLKQEIRGLILPRDKWTEPYMNPDCEICAYLEKIPCGDIYKDYLESIMRTRHNFLGNDDQFDIIQDELYQEKLHAFYECNAKPETKQWWVDNQERLDAEQAQDEHERKVARAAYLKRREQDKVKRELALKQTELQAKPNADIATRQALKFDILKLTHQYDQLDEHIGVLVESAKIPPQVLRQRNSEATAARSADSAGSRVFQRAGVTLVLASKSDDADEAPVEELFSGVVDPSSAGSRVISAAGGRS